MNIFVDGALFTSLQARIIAPRDWLLAVAALQITVDKGALQAQVRAHITGAAEAQVRQIAAPCLVQIGAPRPIECDRSGLSVFLDDQFIDSAPLQPIVEGARAFAHAFCKFHRDGRIDPGFDLTDLIALPPGQKYPRRVTRSCAPDQTVSIFYRV